MSLLPEVQAAIACVQRLSELFLERRRQLAASAGLTEQQWAVFEEISSEHFMPSLFARQRDSSTAAVSKILRQLLEKEVVTVHLAQDDGRHRRYELTAKGRRIVTTIRKARSHAIEAVWGNLEPAELEAFTRFGTVLVERLERYAADIRERQ